jgi:hypothetical protein
MSTLKINQSILFSHMKAESAHDLENTLATIHPEAVFHDQPVGLHLKGRNEVAKHYKLWWHAFGVQTDGGALHWVNDNLMIGESHFVGEHIGPFLGIEPTNKSIRFPLRSTSALKTVCYLANGFFTI